VYPESKRALKFLVSTATILGMVRNGFTHSYTVGCCIYNKISLYFLLDVRYFSHHCQCNSLSRVDEKCLVLPTGFDRLKLHH